MHSTYIKIIDSQKAKMCNILLIYIVYLLDKYHEILQNAQYIQQDYRSSKSKNV